MSELKQREAEFEADALRINAGRKPKFGDLMRNPWASESNPQRDGYFVRERRQGGRFNPGHYYEFTDKCGKFWETNAKYAFFIDTQPEATKPAQDRGERNTQGPLLIARIKRYKEAFGCSTAEAKEACEYGLDLNSDQTAFVSPPKKDLSLACQVIQDTNDTLREQYEALVQLKAENDQLRAALASPADALVAGDRVDAERWRFRQKFLLDGGAVLWSQRGCQYRNAQGAIICQGGTEEEAIDAAIHAQKDGHG